MSDHLSSRCAIVGAGMMGRAYAKVLCALGAEIEVFGRGADSAAAFFAETGIIPRVGALQVQLDKVRTANALPTLAIVAVNVPALYDVASALIDVGVKRILLEKPGALTLAQVQDLAQKAKSAGVECVVGYNRRFFASTARAREIIADDGGPLSVKFDFTERVDFLFRAEISPVEMENIIFTNSSHVINLAFHLGGSPTKWMPVAIGEVDWHPRGAIFTGAGTLSSGALFSYHANLSAPGRWSVEVMTRNHRLILSPMEQLQVQRLGTFVIEQIEIDDTIDKIYKPGLYRQVQAFLTGEGAEHLVPITVQAQHMDIYDKMLKHAG